MDTVRLRGQDFPVDEILAAGFVRDERGPRLGSAHSRVYIYWGHDTEDADEPGLPPAMRIDIERAREDTIHIIFSRQEVLTIRRRLNDLLGYSS